MTTLSQERIKSVYERIAPVFGLFTYFLEGKARKRTLERAQIQNGESVLEVAVGAGLTFSEILKSNPDGTNEGIDITPALLSRAKARAAKIGGARHDLRLADARDLPFEDGRFDKIINSYMFDLLPEESWDTVLKEFKRVLKPGGHLVLVNLADASKSFGNKIWNAVYDINPAFVGGCRGIQLDGHVERAGFENREREDVMQFGTVSEIISCAKPR